MSWPWVALLLANYAAALVVVGHVLRRRSDPTGMLAWIFAILTLPVLGMSLYGLVGSARIRRRIGKRRKRIASLVAQAKRRAEFKALRAEQAAEKSLEGDQFLIERMTRRLLGVPATSGNRVRVFEEANATYYALEEAIHNARSHIHLLYYIWQPDQTGFHFRDLIAQRAREGIDCRVLLDAVGCWKAGAAFLEPWHEAGVNVAFFLPVNPLRRRWSINQRNHRKIAVFDSRVAFMGSQNIGDEYLGRLKKLSPWRDSHMRVEGPAVLSLEQTFVEDWYFATHEDLVRDNYFPEPEMPGDSIVQIVATGPDQDVSVLEQIIFAAVSTARESIYISTPYFVPGPEIRMALLHAAYRGVRVAIVHPTKHDAPIVKWAARSFYAELIAGGIEIHEYDHGVLHSKLITVDDRWCMLGSANMDMRSFRLNFEITALIYDAVVARELASSIQRDIQRSRRIRMQDARSRRLRVQLLEGAARLFSPLL